MNIDPGDVLNEARDAYSEKNYSVSLEKYQWFVSNAIEIQKTYYGVRLSYCLDEWAQLGGVGNDFVPLTSSNRTLT